MVEREIPQLRLKRTDVETSLEASISALTNVLEFVRRQESATGGDNIRLYRPRSSADEPFVAGTATSDRHPPDPEGSHQGALV